MNEQHHTIESQQTMLLERLVAPQPTVIGLEGGPCSGKSTLAREIIAQALTLDRPVEVLAEAATEHIESRQAYGISVSDLLAHDRPGYIEFEHDVLGTIVDRIQSAKQRHAGIDAIAISDRADIGAYVSDEEHQDILQHLGLEDVPLYTMVDKVVYLPSVASESPELYQKLQATNEARYEFSVTSAQAVDAANLQSVRTHPELHIAWGGNFQTKIERLARMVLQPELEGEIKLGITASDARRLIASAEQRGDLLNTMTIGQSYHRVGDQEFRLRQSSGDDGRMHYFFTVKTGEGTFRREIQRSLTPTEYGLLRRAERLGNALLKLRHVIIDEAEPDGRRRLWLADHYLVPELDDWHFETDVDSEAEAEEIADRYAPMARRINESARTLVFK